ncbi:hypothetical protein PHG11b_19 [Flavobacterium phage 11b]|uniref:hypothetical protein n=1 Tax=Flavobacterium phage 11b TaxID=294631 RepID=UPI0000444131|nr:hypothetical protein PHG11b_19 [Flavobacterium phage 11b]CAH56646.1 conserved hypothetical protein [Flavobacterium phage 11b]
MAKYRKLPVEIESLQYTWNNRTNVLDFINKGKKIDISFCLDEFVMIETLEGTMKASIDDYIIRGVKGEFYPCKPDIFESTYELVK